MKTEKGRLPGKRRIRKRFVAKLKLILAAQFKRLRPRFVKKWLTRQEVTTSLNHTARSITAKPVCHAISDALMDSIADEIMEHGSVELYGVCILTLGKYNGYPCLRARLCRRMKDRLKEVDDDVT